MTTLRKLFFGVQLFLFAGPVLLILLIALFIEPTVDPGVERNWRSLGSEPPNPRDIWLMSAFAFLVCCWLVGTVVGLVAWRSQSKLGRRFFA
jgi:hypothetical protein